MSNVFISHSWHDKPLARKLAKTLESFGIRVWLDEAEIKLGDSLLEKISQGIDEMEYVIALLSEKSIASNWVKTELRIAMSQEIKGKRVKVLPIIAQPCSLPNYLEEKFNVDMSSAKAFRQSLPILLDRLNVDPVVASRSKSNAQSSKAVEGRGRMLKIRDRLTRSDHATQYQVLKEIRSYYDKNLFLSPEFTDAVSSLAKNHNPVHIRLQAIQVLGYAGDPNFAVQVEPFLEDDNSAIICASIRALASLKAVHSAWRILEILRTTQDVSVRHTCIEYFTLIKDVDSATLLSLLNHFEVILSREAKDPGTELKIAQAVAQQWDGFGDEVLELLLSLLQSSNAQVRLEVLGAIADTMGELYIGSPRLEERLHEAVKRAFSTGTDVELAKAWFAGFLSKEVDNEIVWKAVLSADRYAVEALLSELTTYNLKSFLDSPQDVNALNQLLTKFGGALQQKVCRVLQNVGNVDALKLIAKYKYKPQKWNAVSVLRAIAEAKEWDESLEELLEVSAKAELDYTPEFLHAFALLAHFRARKVSLDELIEQFPKKVANYGYKEMQIEIKQLLEEFRETADSQQRSKLTRIIKTLPASSLPED
ncbi:MAG: toll/interleukin-1 receptor domain-containing protein [Pyrinomonadaceae bacterium]